MPMGAGEVMDQQHGDTNDNSGLAYSGIHRPCRFNIRPYRAFKFKQSNGAPSKVTVVIMKGVPFCYNTPLKELSYLFISSKRLVC